MSTRVGCGPMSLCAWLVQNVSVVWLSVGRSVGWSVGWSLVQSAVQSVVQ